jgi:hypothetical protein
LFRLPCLDTKALNSCLDQPFLKMIIEQENIDLKLDKALQVLKSLEKMAELTSSKRLECRIDRLDCRINVVILWIS